MKIKFLYFFLIPILFLSCNNDDEDISKLDPEGDCFTVKIDGEFYNSDNIIGTDVGISILIGATKGTTSLQTFGINLFNTNEGIYDLTTQTGTAATAQYVNGLTVSNQYYSTSGTLTIEEHYLGQKRIKGTFEFEGTNDQNDTISFTEGVFDLGYN